jgi:hypothetical protein
MAPIEFCNAAVDGVVQHVLQQLQQQLQCWGLCASQELWVLLLLL